MMLRAFRRHLFSYIEVMVGSVVLVMRWAILTTLCSDFLSLMVQLPYQTVMQVGRMLSMVQQSGKSSAALGGDRWTLANFLRKNMRLCAFLIRVVMLGVQERSSEMWTPRNLKLVTRSTPSPLIWTGRCVPSEVHDDLFSLACVEGQVVVDASLCQVPDLFPVWRLIVFADEPDHGCIVCKLHDCV